MNQPMLVLNNINHRYANGHQALRGLSLEVNEGDIACLLGPSGCGKTTALRVIAGFEPVQSGTVVLQGETVTSPKNAKPPEKRGVGIVFQDAALFPHLNVADNIAFGLQRESRENRRRRVADLLDLVGLTTQADKYPHQLSGGQRQRIAIARAMAPSPALILLDEPFSNLDADLRQSLSADIRGLLKAQNATAVLVTHDQYEAFAMADRIALLSQGKLQQFDDADSLFHRPANRFVAGFIGEGSFVPAQGTSGNKVRCCLGEVIAANATVDKNWQGELLIRPEDLAEDPESSLQGQIESVAFRGNRSLYRVRLNDLTLLALGLPGKHTGDSLGLRLCINQGLVFPLTGET